MSLGVFYGILALLSFALSDVLLKKVSKIEWFSLAVIRILITSLFIGSFILFIGQSLLIPLSEIPILLLIGVLGTLGFLTFIMAMRYSKASVAAAIASSYGLLVILLSWIFYGEQLLFLQYFGMALIFLGMYLTHIQKGKDIESDLIKNKGFYFSLLTFVLWGITFFLIAIPIRRVGAFQASFYLEFIMLLLLSLFIPFRGIKWPSRSNMLYLLVYGIIVAFASVFLTLSIREIGPSLANSIVAGIPFGVLLFAYLWFKERLKPRQYAGIALIVIGLIIVSLVTI